MVKGNLCEEIHVVSIGSQLGTVLANLFMGCHKRNWLQEFYIGEALLYRHNIDDIFLMFKNEIDAKNSKHLNSKHHSIKFTMEKKTNKFLPFLDALIKNEGRTFTTSV